MQNRHLYSRSLILFFLFTILYSGGKSQEVFRQMEEPEAFRHKMQEASVITHSISSDFIQLKYLSFLEEEVESKGVFYFKKENRLRWEYTNPFYYLIIFSGDTVLIRDDNDSYLYDASTGRMFREINNIMLSMVNATILESDDFTFEYFENSSEYKLKLIPHDVNIMEFLSEIRLFINKEDYSVDELFMVERSGDYTHIRFINKRLNEDIPIHIFKLH